jgi:23S rRNA pseudouridine2457 synthase
MTQETLEKLRSGISIRVKGGDYYTTASCEVDIIEKPSSIVKRDHEFREDLPQTWIKMTLTEGKYHQIRKMVSTVYHPCKRLIRISIEDLTLENMQPGEVREINEEEFFSKLKIENWR